MQKKITIIDSTLRDGSHAMRHQFTSKNIKDYSKNANDAGIEILIVGHGNGLGASSLQLGKSLLSDEKMLKNAKQNLTKSKLGAFLIPGFGTIKNDLNPAISCGIEVLMVASHCTEANTTKQHIQYAIKNNIETYGVLMMSHMISAEKLLEQGKLMQEYGVKGIILMDSAGAYLPDDVKKKVSKLVKELEVDIGFHAHNNLGMAIANSVTAVKYGAKIIDCTSRGFGAGAGNCQLEVIVAVLEKMNYKTGLNLYKLMDNSENIIKKLMKKPLEINNVTLTSGLAGIFSGFAPYVIKAAERFKVDPRDILFELGKKKVVAGQEDIIIDVATFLKQKKDSAENNYNIAALQ